MFVFFQCFVLRFLEYGKYTKFVQNLFVYNILPEDGEMVGEHDGNWVGDKEGRFVGCIVVSKTILSMIALGLSPCISCTHFLIARLLVLLPSFCLKAKPGGSNFCPVLKPECFPDSFCPIMKLGMLQQINYKKKNGFQSFRKQSGNERVHIH